MERRSAMTSLRNRLLFAMLAVAGVTLALVALVSTRMVTTEVREFAHAARDEHSQPDFADASRKAEEYFASTKSWEGIAETLGGISASTNRRVVLMDSGG